ncbi:type 1 fimbrial protein [Enterobacter roggenkampii]|uniref:type 1 fimbrial protein n=1 Tax=Enterobacter roggenkampii TaxID=1812935 RepID=UPI0016815A3C|nr:type 1 fimbrial protein [Enterobacter roggenkampii]
MNIRVIISILFTLFFCPSVHAACVRGGNLFADKSISTSTITLPANLTVENRDYAAGEVIYTSNWKAGSNDSLTISGCGRDYTVGYFYLSDPQSSTPAGTTTMPTNITGLGVRVSAMNQAGPNDAPTPINNDWHSGSGTREDHTLNNSQYQVELVATGGPISSGSLTFGSPLAQVEFRESPSHGADGDIASQVQLTNSQVAIKSMGCSADKSAIDFKFGSHSLAEFDSNTTVGGAPDQTVTINCEPGTNVSLTIVATEAAGDNPGHTVIGLTNEGSQDVAKGVGIRLGLKTRTYDSQNAGVPLNAPIALFYSSRNGNEYVSGGTSAQEQLTFSAVYYKTATTVTAGMTNATAVLTLTYN